MTSRSGGHAGSSQAASNNVVSQLAQQDRVPWYKKPNLRFLYLVMFPTCLCVELTSGFDASVLNGLQAVPSWLEYYHYPRSASLGLMSSMFSLGGLVAVPFVPSTVDKFGRRHSILVGSMFVMTGGILQGAALNVSMFNIARLFLGFGTIFSVVAASSLTGELSHPKERAIIGSLFHATHMIGSICAAGATLVTFSMPNDWGWRIPSFLQVVPCLLQISFIWFLPESPRWLISKGREDDAYAILVKYHAEGDENSEFVKAEYAQIEQTLAEEMRNSRMSWKEVFSATGMRKRIIIASFLGLFSKWSGYGLVSYFLSPLLDNIGIHDNQTKNIINFSRAGWNLVNGIFFALTVPRYPRRRMYLASTISLLAIFVAWTAASAEYTLTHSLVSSHLVLVLIFLYSPAYNMAISVLEYTYLVELFPFHIRARGISIFQWWKRIAACVSQFVDPIGIDSAGWKYYLIYCVWIAFGVVFVYVMFPETSGKTLEELTFLFEDDRGHNVSRDSEVEPLLRGWRQAGVHNATADSSSAREVRQT